MRVLYIGHPAQSHAMPALHVDGQVVEMAKTNPLDEFAERLSASLQDGTFVRVVLSGPISADGAPEKGLGRLVTFKGGPPLSLTYRHATHDVTKNLSVPEVASWAREQVGAQFRSALLSTTKRD